MANESPSRNDEVAFLKENCSRLLSGQCTTLRCLKRGGYKGGAFDPAIATCEPYEIAQRLALSETGEPTGSYDRGWNEAIDRAALIADDVWRDENSLAGSKAASRVAQRIRDLKVPA